jgi:hypothetical protein
VGSTREGSSKQQTAKPRSSTRHRQASPKGPSKCSDRAAPSSCPDQAAARLPPSARVVTFCCDSTRLDHPPTQWSEVIQKCPTEMVTKVLCVAEKPSIARAVAGHLSGGTQRVVSFTCSATLISHAHSYIHANLGRSPTHARHGSKTTISHTTFPPGEPAR